MNDWIEGKKTCYVCERPDIVEEGKGDWCLECFIEWYYGSPPSKGSEEVSGNNKYAIGNHIRKKHGLPLMPVPAP